MKDKLQEVIIEKLLSTNKPLETPPYTCPKAEYGEEKQCVYPNCLCEFNL